MADSRPPFEAARSAEVDEAAVLAMARECLRSRTAHPNALSLAFHEGTLSVAGPIRGDQKARALDALARIPGVRRVEDRTEPLRARESLAPAPDRLNELAYQSELLGAGWSPASRLAVGLVGIGALAGARRLPLQWRNVARIFGLASLVRAVTNRYVTELVGSIVNPTMTLQRNLRVDAPVDDVFDFLRDFRNYSRFMSYVESVEVNDVGGLRWTIAGPGGLHVSWDANVQALIPNQLIGWKSAPGSPVHSAGAIRLAPSASGGTDVFVELSYAPPAGAFGYAIASALGFDPRSRIDEDLEVLKLLIEVGLRPAAPTRSAFAP